MDVFTAIGKVIATEKNPSTIDDFYFWTDSNLVLNPFDVVKVNHIQGSVSYGVVEEISHITDAVSFLSSYISSDFGNIDDNSNTFRVGMNYVKARIVSNSDNIYTPLHNDSKVYLATADEIAVALGLADVKNPITCGYIEMYQNLGNKTVTLPVNMDSRFLIGPEGAHLNISGISGLASKTSYAMFLLKSIQDTFSKSTDESVAFVIFNVKGCDLLSIDAPNQFEDANKQQEVYSKYDMLGLSKEPFKNVKYYYPYYSDTQYNTYLKKDSVKNQVDCHKASFYKYEYAKDKYNLDLLFASLDDSTQSMEAILNLISSEDRIFEDCENWSQLLEKIHEKCQTGQKNNEISVASWRKFYKVINKSIRNNSMFNGVNTNKHQVRLDDALKKIKKNEVHVIDIARLSEDMQGFVFGNTIKTIYDLKLLGNDEDESYESPSKIIIFVDELNKYASNDIPKSSPILRQILDIAERGRSLGIILFSAEQFKSAINSRVTGNCSVHAYGRTNALEISNTGYKFIPSVYKSMMTRLKQGQYIIQHPAFRSLLNIKFPEPLYEQFKK